jgi:hypothetical protein
VENRLTNLEGNFRQLEGQMDEELRDVRERITQAQDDLRREREERSAGDDSTVSQIRESTA